MAQTSLNCAEQEVGEGHRPRSSVCCCALQLTGKEAQSQQQWGLPSRNQAVLPAESRGAWSPHCAFARLTRVTVQSDQTWTASQQLDFRAPAQNEPIPGGTWMWPCRPANVQNWEFFTAVGPLSSVLNV